MWVKVHDLIESGEMPPKEKARPTAVTKWLRESLVRTGRQAQLFTSPVGQGWGEPLMTPTTTFDSQRYPGPFTRSGNTRASTTAVFDSVRLNQ